MLLEVPAQGMGVGGGTPALRPRLLQGMVQGECAVGRCAGAGRETA